MEKSITLTESEWITVISTKNSDLPQSSYNLRLALGRRNNTCEPT